MKSASDKFSFVFSLDFLCIIKAFLGIVNDAGKLYKLGKLILIVYIMTYIWATHIEWSMCKVGHPNLYFKNTNNSELSKIFIKAAGTIKMKINDHTENFQTIFGCNSI